MVTQREPHNRACRRELKRRGIDPSSKASLEACKCNWPWVVFGDQASQEAAKELNAA